MSARCTLCGAAAPRRFDVGGYAVHRCAPCDLEFVWPAPSPEALRAVYERGYFEGGGAGYDDYFGRERDLARRKATARLDALAALGHARGRLLDVGCAAGYFLAAARDRGFDVYGVEPSPEARARVAPDLAARVLPDLAAARDRGPFDVVTLWDVLEHLPDPAAALRALAPLLAPGAAVAVVCPVIGNVNTRVAPRTWDQYKPPEHLWFFSPRALRALVARTLGATIVREDVAWERPARFTRARAEAALWRAVAAAGGRALVTDSVAVYGRVGAPSTAPTPVPAPRVGGGGRSPLNHAHHQAGSLPPTLGEGVGLGAAPRASAGGPRAVLHLVPSTAWGGAERVAETLAGLARAHGWRASLDLPRAGESYARWALRARPEAAVVHAHLPWPDRLGPAVLAARGRPLVVTFHLLPEPGRWPRDRLLKVPGEHALRVVGRLRRDVRWVALSRADQATLSSLLGAPVTVVRNAPPPPAPARDPLRWPDGAVRLLSVGRLEWQKGLDRMLDALAHPSLAHLPWHWMVVGDGADRAALAARAARLGIASRVTFAGARPAADGLCAAELVLLPSRREGMPLVPLEALEAGVPVVASPIAPHRELFEEIPAALLPDDERRWPARLASLLAAPDARRALAAAQANVVGNTPRDALWTAYEALYTSPSP